jgi:hypothetical protein
MTSDVHQAGLLLPFATSRGGGRPEGGRTPTHGNSRRRCPLRPGLVRPVSSAQGDRTCPRLAEAGAEAPGCLAAWRAAYKELLLGARPGTGMPVRLTPAARRRLAACSVSARVGRLPGGALSRSRGTQPEPTDAPHSLAVARAAACNVSAPPRHICAGTRSRRRIGATAPLRSRLAGTAYR